MDRLSAIAPLISGLMVAAIGGWATLTVSRNQRAGETSRAERQLAVQRSSTIPPLIPYLGSEKEEEKRAALLAIDAFGDPALATKLAEIYGGEGSKSALSSIAARSPREVAAAAEKSLDTLFSSLKSSIVRLAVDGQPAASGFFVAPGHVLTAGLTPRHDEARVTLHLHTAQELAATVLAWDDNADLTLLATSREDLPALTFQKPGRTEEEIMAIFGQEITAIGYAGSSSEPRVRPHRGNFYTNARC